MFCVTTRVGHAFIADRMLREAATFYRSAMGPDPQQARRLMVEADLCEQVAAMIETDPTGGCDRLPQPSFEDEQPFYTLCENVRWPGLKKP